MAADLVWKVKRRKKSGPSLSERERVLQNFVEGLFFGESVRNKDTAAAMATDRGFGAKNGPEREK